MVDVKDICMSKDLEHKISFGCFEVVMVLLLFCLLEPVVSVICLGG